MHPHPERIPFKRNEKTSPIALRSHPDNPRTTNITITNIMIPITDKTSILKNLLLHKLSNQHPTEATQDLYTTGLKSLPPASCFIRNYPQLVLLNII